MGNKIFQKYLLIWLIALAAFNAVVFLLPAEVFGLPRQSGAFWTGYIFITLSFLGNLVCAWFALRSGTTEKLFYNIPLLTISYSALITMLIIGGIFMIVPLLPVRLGIILCVLVLAFNVIAVIKANTAAGIVQKTEARVHRQTAVMRDLTAQAESLVTQAKSEEARTECRKVCEALHYSDPVSAPSLTGIEAEISEKMKGLSLSLESNDASVIKKYAESILMLIESRNRQCRMLK